VYVEFDYFTPAYSGQNYLLAWFVVRSGWEQTGEGGADTSLPSEVEAIMRVLRGVEVTIQPPRGVRDDT